jgi:uncharacterized membrane protein
MNNIQLRSVLGLLIALGLVTLGFMEQSGASSWVEFWQFKTQIGLGLVVLGVLQGWLTNNSVPDAALRRILRRGR